MDVDGVLIYYLTSSDGPGLSKAREITQISYLKYEIVSAE